MRIMLLCTSFNGLSQRVFGELRRSGHDVRIRLAIDEGTIRADVRTIDPELIVCPFLRHRVPDDVWRRYRTIIVHPGPPGDRGPSSLDWAISQAHSRWGVTAIQAVEEMDAGPIWASRAFAMPATTPRKSEVYNGPVADAAVSLVSEVVDLASDPTFRPVPLDRYRSELSGRLRPAMRAEQRRFAWTAPTAAIVGTVRASDGSPGASVTLCGMDVAAYDVRPGPELPGRPGTVVGRRHGAVLVRTGDGTLWVGHLRRLDADGCPDPASSLKLPATRVLEGRLNGAPELAEPYEGDVVGGGREICYSRRGDVGTVHFDFYNGAMSTAQCRRLTAALEAAAADDTRVIVIGGGETFSNGIHLNVIEAAPDPAIEAWRNINAIDDACQQILTADQIVISSVRGPAGAGGVMMALCADVVLAHDAVVLNPHYRTMGLYGSEFWTYVLPRRIGDEQAARVTDECLPVSAIEAAGVGLVDEVIGVERDRFSTEVHERAAGLAGSLRLARLVAEKRARRDAHGKRRPLVAYRARELAEMRRDIMDDRNGFAAARRAFVTKRPPHGTPAHLAADRHTENTWPR
jgi:putative two-component system protein, hydrogenase maturation factor HypX/HoxX